MLQGSDPDLYLPLVGCGALEAGAPSLCPLPLRRGRSWLSRETVSWGLRQEEARSSPGSHSPILRVPATSSLLQRSLWLLPAWESGLTEKM